MAALKLPSPFISPALARSSCLQNKSGCKLTGQRNLQVCSASLRKDFQLLDALWGQARKETLPWIQDLAFPVLGVNEDIDDAAEQVRTLPPHQLADPDSKFVGLPEGLRMHYKERPAAAGTSSTAPTILLIHGFNGSTFSWRANLDAVADATGCRVIAYDRPPFGLSERALEWGKPGQPLTFNPYELPGSMRLTESFLDALGVGPVVAVGHSAGALVALELARRRPWQVKALSLVAPAVPTTTENSLLRRATFGSQLRLLATRAILQSDIAGLRYVRRQLLKQRDKVKGGDLGFKPHPSTASSVQSLDLSLGSSLDSPEDSQNGLDPGMEGLWEAAAEQAMEEAAEGYTRPLRARDWDRAALLNLRAFSLPAVYDYSCIDKFPVLIVQGDDDGALTQNAKTLASILQQRGEMEEESGRNGGRSAHTVFLEMSCGHVPNEELPAEFNAALIDFLKLYAV